jgi:glycosyltransferase involved in cell wall biosynthesis
MRIAQVAPLHESVPPKTYGGTERILSWLTEGLIKKGHDVTLFASGDSVTRARLISIVPRALRLEPNFMVDKVGYHALMFEQVLKLAASFDIIHFHSDYAHLPYVRLMQTPTLTTTHSRLDYLPLKEIWKENNGFPVVSISQAQRGPIPWLNWQATVHHGMPEEMFTLNEKPGEYVLFLGRICPEKRPDRAIEIARKAGIHLKIAAKVDPVDREYFNKEIKPLLDGPLVEYIGEVNDSQKQELIGNAIALIHPIEFPEPFGIVMIESLACGTPIVAFRTGSIPEVVDEGVTGFVVDNVDDAVKALQKVKTLDRKRCREVFEKRFSSSRMVDDYLTIYEQVILRSKISGVVAEPDIAVLG